MINRSKKYCINGCNRFVFAKDRCIYCYRKEILYPKQKLKEKKVYRINKVSPKRAILIDEYSRKKKERWKQLIAEGKNRCFFSDIKLDPEIIPDFHHLFEKENDHLIDMDNTYPCLFKYHREYHDLKRDYEYLAREDKLWYSYFLERIKISYPILYHKEMYLINKANAKTTKKPTDYTL